MRFLARMFAVALLTLSLGLHWAVLQSVAWTGMLATRVQTGSILEAIQTTFDGQHPCRLCLAVRDGKAESEKGQELPPWKLAKMDVFPSESGTVWLRVDPRGDPLPRLADTLRTMWEEPPDSPPPRRV